MRFVLCLTDFFSCTTKFWRLGTRKTWRNQRSNPWTYQYEATSFNSRTFTEGSGESPARSYVHWEFTSEHWHNSYSRRCPKRARRVVRHIVCFLRSFCLDINLASINVNMLNKLFLAGRLSAKNRALRLKRTGRMWRSERWRIACMRWKSKNLD